MSTRRKSRRQQRRSKEGVMPQGGAGLIRFYQDQSIGFKVSPITTIVLAVILIVLVIVAHQGWLNWLLGGSVAGTG